MHIEMCVREDLNSSCSMFSVKRDTFTVVRFHLDLADERDLKGHDLFLIDS
jgi:hypothetical protein